MYRPDIESTNLCMPQTLWGCITVSTGSQWLRGNPFVCDVVICSCSTCVTNVTVWNVELDYKDFTQ